MAPVILALSRIIAVAVLMALAGASNVSAAQAGIERLYWNEIRKDARIYVFNDPVEVPFGRQQLTSSGMHPVLSPASLAARVLRKLDTSCSSRNIERFFA
jgi:hypothetical protein